MEKRRMSNRNINTKQTSVSRIPNRKSGSLSQEKSNSQEKHLPVKENSVENEENTSLVSQNGTQEESINIEDNSGNTTQNDDLAGDTSNESNVKDGLETDSPDQNNNNSTDKKLTQNTDLSEKNGDGSNFEHSGTNGVINAKDTSGTSLEDIPEEERKQLDEKEKIDDVDRAADVNRGGENSNTETKLNLTGEELEEEWKKLTEDPNYPSLMTTDNLTSRTIKDSTEMPDAGATNASVMNENNQSNTSVPTLDLHCDGSEWGTQIPTYTSGRSKTDIRQYNTSLNQTPSHHHHTQTPIYRFFSNRRQSLPQPTLSSKEPFQHKEDFLDEKMLISSIKLDSLLLRLFSKQKITQQSMFTPGHDTNQQTQQTSFAIFDNAGSDLISMDPVTWNLQPMKASEKETLQSELPFLEENLKPKEPMKRLFLDGVITHMDYNQLTHTEGQGDRAVIRLLIGTLQRRGKKAYPAFIRALKELDYIRISDRLEATEREIAQGMEQDREDLERRTKMEMHRGLETYKSNTPSWNTVTPSIMPLKTTTERNTVSKPQQLTAPSPSGTQPSVPPTPTSNEDGITPDPNREEYNKKVENQLAELNAELKALHEDINNLQTARTDITAKDGQHKDNSQASSAPQKSSSCVIL